MQKFVVGETYAFVPAHLKSEYGEWIVTEIRGDGGVMAVGKRKTPTLMAYTYNEAEFFRRGAFAEVEHIERFEPVVEEDWS